MAQFDVEDCSLNVVHAVVVGMSGVVVLGGLAPVAQQSHLFSQVGSIGDDCPPFATGTEVLAGVER